MYMPCTYQESSNVGKIPQNSHVHKMYKLENSGFRAFACSSMYVYTYVCTYRPPIPSDPKYRSRIQYFSSYSETQNIDSGSFVQGFLFSIYPVSSGVIQRVNCPVKSLNATYEVFLCLSH